MLRSRRSPAFSLVATALALSLCLLSPGLLRAATVYGAETPQALVERIKAAGEAGDVAEMAACLAPEDRAELTLGLVLASGMMVAFLGMGGSMAAGMAEGMAEAFADEEGLSEEQKAEVAKAEKEMAEKSAAIQKRYEEILAKHGLGEVMGESSLLTGMDESAGADLSARLAGVDQPALMRDLLALMQELGDKEEGAEGAPGPGLDLPKEVTDYQIEGDRATARAGDKTLEFVRVEGRWYLKPPQEGDGG